jgi:LPXTG-motif cell wall-anchored protein
MVASASASASAPVRDQIAASREPTGRVKTVSRLPNTGGSPLVSLTAGVLLMGGGLLLRRISH